MIPTPVDNFGPNVAAIVELRPMLEISAAFVATGVMSYSGADGAIEGAVQRHAMAPGYGAVMVVTGFILPPLTAGALYATGAFAGQPELAQAGVVAAQALAVTMGATVLLKWVTGRPFPLNGYARDDSARLGHPEFAREWEPFKLRQGIGAWPSGHTSVSVSVAAALTAYFPDNRWLPWVAYPVAASIAAGMLVGEHHWGSDIVAGALFGHAIGDAMGRQMRSGTNTTAARRFMFAPLAGAEWGISVIGAID